MEKRYYLSIYLSHNPIYLYIPLDNRVMPADHEILVLLKFHYVSIPRFNDRLFFPTF